MKKCHQSNRQKSISHTRIGVTKRNQILSVSYKVACPNREQSDIDVIASRQEDDIVNKLMTLTNTETLDKKDTNGVQLAIANITINNTTEDDINGLPVDAGKQFREYF